MIYPQKILLNGRLIDPRLPALSAYDRGFLYGDGVYETLRIYDGKAYDLPGHFRRLKHSARGLGIPVPFSSATLERGIARLLRANGLREAVVRVTVSRGEGPLGFDPRPAGPPTWVVMAHPAKPHPAWCYEKGIRLALTRVRRNPRIALNPSFKTTNNINNILAKRESIRRRAYEALMLNTEGFVAEGTISNVFFVKGRTLKTPSLDCGILEGVTRSAVLRLARARGLRLREARFRPAALFAADEVFITSTTMEVMPATALIDETGRPRRVGSGRVGPWAKALRGDFQAWIHRRKRR